MNDFLNDYKKGGASLEGDAFDYLVGDMLIKEKRGVDKAREITALDMESQSPVDFAPCMIYTFLYISDKPEAIGNKIFSDMVPVILCFTANAHTVTGLNFNLIPNDELFTMEKGVSAFIKAIENETGLNVSGAVRTYNIKNIKKPRMIEYDAWKYVPALSFKDAIRGAGLAELQADMIKANR